MGKSPVFDAIVDAGTRGDNPLPFLQPVNAVLRELATEESLF
jgi:hypothetical protein